MTRKNIIPHQHTITTEERTRLKGHQPAVIWFTGLSGSGKSTVANALEQRLHQEFGAHTYLLDGDNIRAGLNSDLGFSIEDRQENIRRIGEVCKLFHQAGLIVLTAFISPLRADRDTVRARVPQGHFIEAFIDCPIEVCEQRDPKGLYKKARSGEIRNFTGIDSVYESPLAPEIRLDTSKLSIDECAQRLIDYLLENQLIQTQKQ